MPDATRNPEIPAPAGREAKTSKPTQPPSAERSLVASLPSVEGLLAPGLPEAALARAVLGLESAEIIPTPPKTGGVPPELIARHHNPGNPNVDINDLLLAGIEDEEPELGDLRRNSAEDVVERKLATLIERREYRIAGVLALPYQQARNIDCKELLERNENREGVAKEEQDTLPPYQLVIAGMERYYKLPEEQQITQRELAIHNSFCRDYLEYMKLQETDPRLADIRKRVETIGRQHGITEYTRQVTEVGDDGNVIIKEVPLGEHDLIGRIQIIGARIANPVDADGNPLPPGPENKNYNVIRHSLNQLKRGILDQQDNEDGTAQRDRWVRDLPEAERNRRIVFDDRYKDALNSRRMAGRNGDLVAELEILSGLLAEDNAADPRIAQIATLIENHENHPVFALMLLNEQAHQVYQEIYSGSQAEKQIKVPTRPFQEVLNDFNAAAPDSQEREQARREIENYLEIARQIKLLDHSEIELDGVLEKLILRMKGNNGKDDVLTHRQMYRRLVNGTIEVLDPAESIDDMEADMLERFVRENGGRTNVNVGNQVMPVAMFTGLLAYDLEEGRKSIINYFDSKAASRTAVIPLDASGNPIDRLRGCWNWQEAERRLSPDPRRRGEYRLWEITGAGYYQVYASTFGEVRDTMRSMSIYFRSGALRKDAQTLLGELEYLQKALLGAPIPPEEIVLPDNYDSLTPEQQKEITQTLTREAQAKTQGQLADLRREFYIENLAYLCELFNRSYNGPYLAAIYGRLSDATIDGMVNWMVTPNLHDGQVFLASMFDQFDTNPEAQLRYRMQGRHGQFFNHTEAMLVLHQDERDSLATKMVGHLINDRHISRDGIYSEGEGAVRDNIALLGVDQPDRVWAAIVPNDPVLTSLLMLRASGATLTLEARTRLELYDLQCKLGSLRYVGETKDLLRFQELGGTLTPHELKALRLRRVKLLMAEGVRAPRNPQERVDFDEYKRAWAEARESVQVYMQFMSMSGEKTERGGPGLLCDPRAARTRENPVGEQAYFSTEAKTADELPIWMGEHWQMFAVNMADIQIADHNKQVREAIARVRQSGGRVKLRRIDENGQIVEYSDDKHRNGYTASELVGLWIARSSDTYKDLLAQARDDAARTLFFYGWRAGLVDDEGHKRASLYQFDLVHAAGLKEKDKQEYTDDRGDKQKRYVFKRAKDAAGNYIKVVDPHNENKPVTVLSASRSVFGRHIEQAYVVNQREIQDQICSEWVYRQALDLRSGKKKPEEVDIVAVQRLIIDPTLERIPTFYDRPVYRYTANGQEVIARSINEIPQGVVPEIIHEIGDLMAGPDPATTEESISPVPGRAQQNGKEVLIGAAAEENYLRFMFDARQTLCIVFDDLTEFGIPNFDGATKRLMFPQALIASNWSRWAPRARWIASKVYSGYNSLKSIMGMKNMFEDVKNIKRKDPQQARVDQEVTDPPLHSAHAESVNNQVQQNGTYVGSTGEGKSAPGFFEKPTAEFEKIMDEDTLTEMTTLVEGTNIRRFSGHVQFQKFWRIFEESMSRAKAMMDPGLSILSKNYTGDELWDLRHVDYYKIDQNGVVTPGWRFNTVAGGHEGHNQTRISLTNVGRARHLSRPLADVIMDYLDHFELRSGVCTIVNEAPVRPFQGGKLEYTNQAAWVAFLDTEIDPTYFHHIEDLHEYIGRETPLTIRQLWKDKMARR